MAIHPKELDRVENTVVGESILISGKLEGDEDLTVRGRVHGSITLTRTLIVEPTGVVKADATVRNAIISGVVVGNITASESVHLTSECRMVGDINSPRVIIVEGAAFRGRIDMGEVAEPQLEERPSRPQTIAPSRSTSYSSRPSPVSARPTMAPSRPAFSPPRPPPAPPRPPPAVRSASRPAETPARPPAPPPPPPAPKAASGNDAATVSAPVAAGIAKRKVVVKRKK
jgi:cytoskeletal protein CcmA (bactofilin family)